MLVAVFLTRLLFNIVAGILSLNVSWADGLGSVFETKYKNLTGDCQLDCGLVAEGACFDVFNSTSGFEYTYGPQENALAFFTFRLLHQL